MSIRTLQSILDERFAFAIAELTGRRAGEVETHVRPAGDAKFGDYQCNAAMVLAKSLGTKPRDVAQKLVEAVHLEGVAALEIAGPGFINIRLDDAFLSQTLAAVPAPPDGAGVDRLGLARETRPQRVILDYSSPNIAKQMHVGHLRSTVIGDVFARLLTFLGHDVVRQNHVGDWGTQFGMLIRWYRENPMPSPAQTADVLEAIEGDYRGAQARFKGDEAFAAGARADVGLLQGGDVDARRTWREICRLSREQFRDTYLRLGVLLRDGDACGESFYNDRLAPVVEEIRKTLGGEGRSAPGGPRVQHRVDDGADCLFFWNDDGTPAFQNAEGQPLPMIIRKSDGAYLYATTDLAAIRYRISELGGRRLIYVTDPRQKLHFQMFFAAARAMGWAAPDISLEHVTFGSVLGEDRKPLKTRDGQNVKLRELLDESEQRAFALLEAREAEAGSRAGEPAVAFSAAEKREIARVIGIAAVKYADLARDRETDYVFSWDKMLALTGNTAPYLLYAYARIRSIERRAASGGAAGGGAAEGIDAGALYQGRELRLEHPTERALGLRLARLPDALAIVAAELAPHMLCAYLYDLASDFMRFYEACPVIQVDERETRRSRMRLCDLTARALRLGLNMLGIEPVERM